VQKDDEKAANDIRATIAQLNDTLDELYSLYVLAKQLNIELELENGINGEVDLRVDGVKPYKMKIKSIRKRLEL